MPVEMSMSKGVTLGNTGITLAISDGKGHVGDLRIGRGKVVWMKGQTTEKNGQSFTMKEFVDLLNSA